MNDQHLSMIFETAPVGLVLVDSRSGRLLQANKCFWALLRNSSLDEHAYCEENPHTNKLLAMVHPEDRTHRDLELARMLSGKSSGFSIDMRFQQSDGCWLWFNSTVKATWQPGEKPTSYVVVFQEIDQRKNLEKSLARSEDLLVRTLDSLSEAVFVIDSRGRTIEYCNHAACCIFGYRKEELTQNSTRLLHVDEEHYHEFARRSETDLKSGTPYLGEFEMRRADGEVFPTEHEVHPISLQCAGWRDGLVSVIRDLSERKRKEQELLKLYQALEQSPVAVILTDLESKIEYVNKKYTELTGYEKDEVLGQGALGINLNDALCGLEKQILDDAMLASEWQGRLSCQRHKDGSFLAQGTISPIYDHAGICTHHLITLIDITEKHALQKASEQSGRLVAVGTLAAGVAHEINNPNSVILSNLKILQDVWKDVTAHLDKGGNRSADLSLGGLLYPEKRHDLQQLFTDCLESGERIRSIVKDLKAFSTVESRADSEIALVEEIDLNEVVETACRMLRSIIGTSTDHFSIDLQPGLPKVLGSFLRIEQVVVNLLINACQALPSRQCAVSIKTRFDPGGQKDWIEVHDQGTGIPAELQSQILEPFFTTRRTVGGSGLGLAISDTIVKEHGGEIITTSTPGEETCVSIVLPVLGSKDSL